MMRKLTIIFFIFILFISAPAIDSYGFCHISKKGDVRKNLVVIFKGPHNKMTGVFKVKSHWQIIYHTVEPDRHFSIVVHAEHGKYIELAANEIGPKEGKYYQEKGGVYYLDVEAEGNWTVEILQVPKKPIKKLKAKEPSKGDEVRINRLVGEIGAISQEINDILADAQTNKFNLKPAFLKALVNSLKVGKESIGMIDELYKAGEIEVLMKLARVTVDMLKTTKLELKKALLPEKEKLLTQHYTEPEGVASSNTPYETGDTINLHNPSDTTVAIYKDEALGNLTNMFTNGISAMIMGSKKFPDKPTVYKVLILLKDGSEYIGWVAENSISN